MCGALGSRVWQSRRLQRTRVKRNTRRAPRGRSRPPGRRARRRADADYIRPAFREDILSYASSTRRAFIARRSQRLLGKSPTDLFVHPTRSHHDHPSVILLPDPRGSGVEVRGRARCSSGRGRRSQRVAVSPQQLHRRHAHPGPLGVLAEPQRAYFGQNGVPQPVRLHQGPHRAAHALQRRAHRPPEARHDGCGGDVRQHRLRHRHGVRLRGYEYIVITNEKTSKEKVDSMKAYGGEVLISPSGVSPDDPSTTRTSRTACARRTRRRLRRRPVQQPVQRRGVRSHARAGDLEADLGEVTHFIAGGSTATVSGTGRFLGSQNPDAGACSWRIRARPWCFGTTSWNGVAACGCQGEQGLGDGGCGEGQHTRLL